MLIIYIWCTGEERAWDKQASKQLWITTSNSGQQATLDNNKQQGPPITFSVLPALVYNIIWWKYKNKSQIGPSVEKTNKQKTKQNHQQRQQQLHKRTARAGETSEER